jgi:aryl-alcohol dehydrogenase-like predicted oxidoreductase
VASLEQRTCGTSSLQLSALGLGCWQLGGSDKDYWGPTSQQEADAVIRRAVDLGITYFDTAEVYNDGRSEAALGNAIQGLRRDNIVIGTKIPPSAVEPNTLVAHCEASLKRLKTDYIDLYMVHWPITPRGIAPFTKSGVCPSAEDAFATLLSLQQQGKIRHIGVSNFGVEKLKEAASSGATIAANQLAYNLLSRAIEVEVLPYCRQQGTGVIAYMSLLQGLLAGAYPNLDSIPPLYRRTRHFSSKRSDSMCRHGEDGAEVETDAVLAGLRALAAEGGLSMSDLALKWALAANGMTCVLVGCRRVGKLEENVRAASQPLAPEIVNRLNQITQPVLNKLGPCCDLWESPANDRTR